MVKGCGARVAGAVARASPGALRQTAPKFCLAATFNLQLYSARATPIASQKPAHGIAMVRNAGTCLYKEARLNIEPAHPGSTVSFTLPASSGHTFGLQTRAKRSVIDESDVLKDDEAFAKRHLATDGSMFFRRRGSYPRSFLWRVLDGRKTLEIQATDLDHDARDPYEANLTLLFHFTSPIRPFCVAFADPDHRNALTVFAITTANELYCITLPCEFFARPSVSEVEIDDWCKRTTPNLISANTAYRLVAVNANQLLVSLGNGSVLRLVRDNRDDVIWTEATFQNTNWSLTLRGVLPWKGQQTVRFGNADLVATSAAAVAISPDDQHLITICLDHTLRIFNLQSGKMTRQHDLLNLLDGAQERNQSHLLGPSQSTLMQVVNISGAEGAAYYIVVYSPIRHEFKFWGVRDAEMDDPVAFTDLQPDFSFVPPIDELMNATVWTLEEFFVVKAPGSSWKGTELWLRARSGPSSKVYSITFDPSDDEDRLQRVWKSEWTTVDPGPLSVEGLRKNPSHPGEQDWDSSDINEFDATEQWLQFLFYPGRFTTATLEAALSILRKGLDRDRSASKPRGSLKDRLCASILEATKYQRRGSDVETFERNTAEQWEAYYRLVKDLHKRRGESLSLAYDYTQDMPWLVLSDYLSAVRKSSTSETIASNAAATVNGTQLSPPLRKALNKQASESRDLLRLLNAAASFRRRLSPSFQQDLKQRLHTDLLQSRPITIIDRMEQMEADCGLTDILTEDDLASLIEDLGTDVKHLSTDMFLDALETLKFESRGGSRKQTQIARYGLKALVRISSESLDFNYETLLDLLVLILFMQFEEDLSDEFDASKVFVELMLEFKDWLVLNWIATTVWSRPTPTGPASTQLMKSMRETSRTSSQFPMTQTALEGMYGDGTCLIDMPATMKTELLTYWSQNWIASIFSQHTFDSAVEDMMGKLVFQKEYKLAKDFSKFLPESNWSTYLKGRMHVALGEHVLASVCFQKAAYNLGKFTS